MASSLGLGWLLLIMYMNAALNSTSSLSCTECNVHSVSCLDLKDLALQNKRPFLCSGLNWTVFHLDKQAYIWYRLCYITIIGMSCIRILLASDVHVVPGCLSYFFIILQVVDNNDRMSAFLSKYCKLVFLQIFSLHKKINVRSLGSTKYIYINSVNPVGTEPVLHIK